MVVNGVSGPNACTAAGGLTENRNIVALLLSEACFVPETTHNVVSRHYDGCLQS